MKLTNRHILLLILIVAAILRFWDYFFIPFTHDEFSAFFRTGFTNFHELIEKGVKTDTHPAGVQVFMNYWILLFGEAPWVVKLPFTLMGLAAVFIVYQLGKLWYNETIALVSASFMACLQFPIMYSQIARPYISGMFLTLLMAWYWSKLVKKPHLNFWKNGILFCVSGALCAYNHHFSLLFAAVIGITGVLYIPKQLLWKYTLLGIGIFVLYMPHLEIFMGQLAQGGVGGSEGWLAPPKNDFLWQFIQYIFHYSWLLLSAVVAIVIYGLLSIGNTFSWKKLCLFSLWFFLPFLIGFYYSRYKNPVLQYSVLIFSFPYLFFLIFGHLKNLSTKVNTMLCLGILLLGTLTLVTNRKHYTAFYNSPYRAIILDQHQAFVSNNSIVRLIDTYPKMNRYYNDHLNVDTNYIWMQDLTSESDLLEFLEVNHKKYEKLFLGTYSMTKPLYVPIISEYYPTIEKLVNYEGGYSYTFNKENSSQSHLLYENFDHSAGEHNISTDSTYNSHYYTLNEEYMPSYQIELDSLSIDKNDFFDFSVDVQIARDYKEVLLVTDISRDGEVVHWSAENIKKFDRLDNNWFTAHHTVNLAVQNLDLQGATLKTYLWNRDKTKLKIDNYTCNLRKGNPLLYGLYEEID